MTESIMRRQIHHESMPPISPRTIFAWEVDQQGFMVLRHYYTTTEDWSITMMRIEKHRVMLISDDNEVKLNMPFQFQAYTQPEKWNVVMRLLPDHPEKEVEIVHVVYEAITSSRVKSFTLYHRHENRWDEHYFPAPEYDSIGFDFEYFVLRSDSGQVAEVTPLWNLNHEIAVHLGHGYLNIV